MRAFGSDNAGNLGCVKLSGLSWRRKGHGMGPYCVISEQAWSHLETSWGAMGPSWVMSGPAWSHLATSGGARRPTLGLKSWELASDHNNAHP